MMPITLTITVGVKANNLLKSCFNQALLPNLWKQLQLGQKKVTGYFNRPISNLPNIVKIIEKVVLINLAVSLIWVESGANGSTLSFPVG